MMLSLTCLRMRQTIKEELMERYAMYHGKLAKASKGDWVEWAEVRNALQEVLSCPCNDCKEKVREVIDFHFFKEN